MNHSTGTALFYVLLLLLPLSSLVAMRLPLGRVLRMALGWAAIFALVFLVASQKERLRPAWNWLAALSDGNDQLVSGGTVRIAMAEDGHFYARALINGVSAKMLIDSGATETGVSTDVARAAGLDLKADPIAQLIQTANGVVVARRARANAIVIGDIRAHDLPVLVAPASEDLNVIGMNFLSRLRSWRVEGRTLVLEAASKQ